MPTQQHATFPEGFTPVPTGRKPGITFDVDKNRFYLSTSLLKEHRISFGSRVGLAYNSQTAQLLIDKQGRAFYVDKRGYLTSRYFIERSYGGSLASDTIKYAVNPDASDERFVVLDEI